jgi:diguanylate cyclase (GGDEF)-like protein
MAAAVSITVRMAGERTARTVPGIVRLCRYDHGGAPPRSVHDERAAVPDDNLEAEQADEMQMVGEAAQHLARADGAIVALVDGDSIVVRAGSGSAAGAAGQRFAIPGSVAGRCVRSGEPVVCADTAADPTLDQEACERLGVASAVAVPLFRRGKAVGALEVLSARVDGFPDDTPGVIAVMASLITAAFERMGPAPAVSGPEERDELTGLSSRAFLLARLDEALGRSRRSGAPVGLVSLDLDGFRTVNDDLGPTAGDLVLRTIAVRLAATAREGDIVARAGGDEFVAVAEGVPREGLDAMARRFAAVVGQPIALADRSVEIGASVAIATSAPGDTAAALLERAEQRMARSRARASESTTG